MSGGRWHVLATAFLVPLALLAATAVFAFAMRNSALAASAAVTLVTMATFGVLLAALGALVAKGLRSVIALRAFGVCGVAIGSAAIFTVAFRYRLPDVAIGIVHGVAINVMLAIAAIATATILAMIPRRKG